MKRNGVPIPGELFDIRQAEARRRDRNQLSDYAQARLTAAPPKDLTGEATYRRVLAVTSTDGTFTAEEHAEMVTAVVMRART